MATENNSLGVLGKVPMKIRFVNQLPKEVQQAMDARDPAKQRKVNNGAQMAPEYKPQKYDKT